MVQLRPSFTPSQDLIIALASRRQTISPSRPLVRVVPSPPLLRLSPGLIFFRTQMPLSHLHPCGSIIDSSSTLQRPPSQWRCTMRSPSRQPFAPHVVDAPLSPSSVLTLFGHQAHHPIFSHSMSTQAHRDALYEPTIGFAPLSFDVRDVGWAHILTLKGSTFSGRAETISSNRFTWKEATEFLAGWVR
jgi:hypothetical protein